MVKKKRLSKKEYARAIWEAGVLSLKTAPMAVSFKMANAILNAILPIVLTYFAALTTTELAAAFAGDPGAGDRAITYVVITAALGLVSTIWSSFDNYIQAILRYKIDAKIADGMYERFHSLDFWRYDDKDTIDTYDKAQRFAGFYSWVFDRLTDIFSQVVSVVGALIALWLVVPYVAIFVFIALIPGIYVQFKLSRAQIEHWNKNVDARRAQSFIEWNLLQPRAITELRLNNLVRYLLDLRAKYRDKDERTRLEFEKKYIGKQILSNVVQAGVELAALIWVTLQIINHTQPLGQFIYVQQIVSRAIGSANSFISALSNIDEDLAQLFDYQKFMAYPIETQGELIQSGAPQKIIFDDVSFTYLNTTKPVLEHITLTINAGEHVAIVGENGAGKSTLIKLLFGLYVPTTGHVLLDDKKLKDIKLETWHRQLSVLQQDYLQYDFTDVKNNVAFGDVSKEFSRRRYEAAIDKAEAADFISKLPSKERTYPTTWMGDNDEEKGVNLSGGQWQRLALARSFYRDTPIIVLDEPTSAIDALAESRIFKHLLDEKNHTIVTISHRLTTVKKADMIYVLQEGKIVESGTHAELVKKDGAYVRLFAAQLDQPAKSA